MNKKEKKSEQTKADLCQAFIELYKDKPIDKISIKEITDRAGYNRATFYLYYKDIYHMLETIEDKFFVMARGNVKHFAKVIGGENDAITVFMRILNDFYQQNRNEFPVLLTRDSNILRNVKILLKEELGSSMFGVAGDELNPRIDLIIEYQLSAAIGVFSLWVENYADVPFEKIMELMYEISTTGFLQTMQKQATQKPTVQKPEKL